jgi:hypothetical protein
MTSAGCKQTYQALRDNRCGSVPAECIEPLLLWLCGSRNGLAETVFRFLGSPFDDAVQLERVYRALDAAVFNHAELLPTEGDYDARRARFRLLSRAFHPDRYPEMSVWLGPRAQTINAAFNTFRKQPEIDGVAAKPASRKHDQVRPPARQSKAVFNDHIGLRERLISLCAPLVHSRYLPQKILVTLAIVCALPLLYLYQQRAQMESYHYDWTMPAGDRAVEADTAGAAAVPGRGAVLTAPQKMNAFPPQEIPAAGRSPDHALHAGGNTATGSSTEHAEAAAATTAGDTADGDQPPAAGAPSAVEEMAHLAPAVAPVRAAAKPTVVERGISDTPPAKAGENIVNANKDENMAGTLAEVHDDPVQMAYKSDARIATPAAAGESPAPVANAVAVLDRFRASFEQGQLHNLLALFTPEPRENNNTGRPWFRQSYGELFEQTRARSLQLDFSDSHADDTGVRLVGRYQMQIRYNNGRRASGSGPVEYQLIPQNDQWKISTIEYQQEQ